jgi:hypothetical protein
MKILSYLMLFLAWLMALYIAVGIVPPEGRRIDCSLAEFHPDFTPEMRKACREQRRIKT